MFALFRRLLPELRIEILSTTLRIDQWRRYDLLRQTDGSGILEYNKRDLWYLMYLYDHEFAEYARSREGMRKYVKCVRLKHKYGNSCYVSKIFDKYHSFNDKPAIITYNDKCEIEIEEWYYNNIRHRDGDKPTHINYNRLCVIWCYMDNYHRVDKYALMIIDLYRQTITGNMFDMGIYKDGITCPISNPIEGAEEIFNYISKERIEALIKSLYG